ncbi:hypothetical protein [Streptococcus iners]|uniref:Uncharacterized protein n=1 Tax=Streptococcus iners TaxID=3028084 RepID=A0AA96VKL9_9STRE|nr:hypothetical protein [Streptococcus sp. 29887]MCK4025015.1 hypothetical protein [Streptococcus suis]MDW8681607.1 hypothetical protein [Streptococcus suis]MDW8750036.1 hypothetical protein [Streptococcus suis]WNY50908.1 hypothetical protein PW252_10090 [Streptococcus sp. 29887]
MYKLVYKLEALSEMVHFQIEDATSATIRASELKPMFDRYLTAYLKRSKKMEDFSDLILDSNESDDAGQREVGNQDDYLHFDYQVRIEVDHPYSNKIVQYDRSEFFFRDNKTKQEKFVLLKTEPVVHFLTPHATLASLIHENFEYFIAISFFGYRKGKYYGQFIVKEPRSKLRREDVLKLGFSRIGREVSFVNIGMNDAKEVTPQIISNINKNIKTVLLDVIERPDILKGKSQILRKEENIDTVIKTLKNYPLFDQIKREKHLENPGDLSVIRYVRGILGLSTSVGGYEIEGEGISRIPNPVKYYLGNRFNGKIRRIHCLLDIESVKELTTFAEDKKVNFHFKGDENHQLMLPSEKEFSYSRLWGILKYLIPKMNPDYQNVKRGKR